jgi:AcrR family transcriptional regulator
MQNEARTPRRQARGQQRMASLLAAAEQVFAEIGYEQATTNLIAARASVSPGTLYQFYPNKEALAEALAKGYAERLRSLHERVFSASAATTSLQEVVDGVVDPFLDFHLRAPAFEALFVGANVSAKLATRIQSLREGITERLVRLMQARAPEMSKEDLFWAAEISLGVFRGVLPTITALKGSRRNRAIREIKALFSRYWEPVLEAGRKTRANKS